MVRQIFLHIGGEKTGTTTLQRFLSKNARRLRRQGFYYPAESNNICFQNKGHFPVAACLIEGDVDFLPENRELSATAVLGALKDTCLTTNDSLVLSCEHFSSRLSEVWQLEALRDALSTGDIKVIFYAREPSELALAAWSTGVQHGCRGPFDFQEVAPENSYFNHLATLDLWGSVFGPKNIVAREYDRDCLVGEDIRWDFCHVLGVDLANPHLDEDENASFDVQRLEILRFINCALPLFEESPEDWRKAEHIRNTVARSIPSGAAIKSLMSARDAEGIKSRFKEVHNELSARYFNGRLSSKWFPSTELRQENRTVVRTPLETDDLLRALRETIIRMAEAEQDAGLRHRASRRAAKIKEKVAALLSVLRERRGSNAPN